MSEEILHGTDGWLFLRGGSNDLLSYYLESNRFGSHTINAWCDLLSQRDRWFKKQGIEYIHLFIPNKLSVYPEYAGIDLTHFESHPIQALMDSLAEQKADGDPPLSCIIDPTPFYLQKKKEYLLYWKTDTHWTFWGCYFAYMLICEKLGVQANTDLINRPYGESEITLDLGGKLAPPVKEKARFYRIIRDSKRIFANELVTYKEKNRMENEVGLHVGSHVIYHNRNAHNPQKVILFGDSFSEYRPHLLTGLLCETFREVHYIWSTSIDCDYVRSQRPDIVITEIVERFMPQVPSDNFSLQAYVQRKLKIVPRSFLQQQLDKIKHIAHYVWYQSYVKK